MDALGKRYGIRPSEILRGSFFDLELDRLAAIAGLKAESKASGAGQVPGGFIGKVLAGSSHRGTRR